MMLCKVGGAVLVVAGCGGLGIWMADQLKRHVRTLEDFRKSIFLLKGEILYANSPLNEAFERVGGKCAGTAGGLFLAVAGRMERQQGEPLYEIWTEEIDKLGKDALMSKEDRQALTAMGEHLGYLDRTMQERTLLLYIEQLDRTIIELREEQKEKSRLYTSLGVMGGLFLTIIMI